MPKAYYETSAADCAEIIHCNCGRTFDLGNFADSLFAIEHRCALLHQQRYLTTDVSLAREAKHEVGRSV